MNAHLFWRQRVWQRQGWIGKSLWLLTLPLAYLYRWAAGLRNLFFKAGLLRARRLSRPVISVGNLTVGGTGKTPTVIALARMLNRRGYRTAVLSRGYKRKEKEPVILEAGVKPGKAAQEEISAAGDEPAMMARLFDLRVGVGENRFEVGERILGLGEVDVFLLDDGFQHRRLKRDLDLVILGSDWEGWTLPSGPFREARGGVRRADVWLITGSAEKWEAFAASRRSSERLVRGSLQAKCLISREGEQWSETPLGYLAGRKIVAVSAIADGSGFHHMIGDWGGDLVDALEYPDHHVYTSQDWQRINRVARRADIVVTTEKDLLKLLCFPFARRGLFALRVAMVIDDEETLLAAVERAIAARKSSDR